jgi:uncharacterized protein YdaU (DUF1376 family)
MEAGRVNYYSFHIGDYTAHTAHLEPMEDLAYRRMLDLYYRTEQPLPYMAADIARLIRLKGEEDAINVVLDEFFSESESGWTHGRCDKEIDAYRRMGEGGKRGAEKRWGKPADSHPIATPSAPHAEANANQEPVTNNQEPITKEKTFVASATPKLPACPTDELIALYHEHLPTLPRVEILNDTRRKHLSARWREVIADKEIATSPDPKAEALAWFAWFFKHANRSAFLTGKSGDWRAGFDFLIAPKSFAKVIEGNYHKAAA